MVDICVQVRLASFEIPYVISKSPLVYACMMLGSRLNKDIIGVAIVVANWKKPILLSRLIVTEKNMIKPAMLVMVETEDITAVVNMRLRLWRGFVGVVDSEVK